MAAAASAGVLAAEPLLQTGKSWDGGAISYPSGDPQVTAVILRIEEGDEPPFHCHPMPTLGYVLTGVVEVETRNGDKAVFRAGEAVVEVMRTVHRGVALEAPVEILVFYAGASGLPTTVLPGQTEAAALCDGVGAAAGSGAGAQGDR
ncbi:MAG: cupin domain-containing protein [Halioglobus sp.]|nr:cupin domain-containing protein [Halioglobus sp.]